MVKQIQGYFKIYDPQLINDVKTADALEQENDSFGAQLIRNRIRAEINLLLLTHFFACLIPKDKEGIRRCTRGRIYVEKVGDLKNYPTLRQSNEDVRFSEKSDYDYLHRLEQNPPYIFVRNRPI